MLGFPAIGSIFTALRRHATLALFAVALVASALFVHSWFDARRAAAQLAATLAAQQKIIADADARQSARDAALSQTLAQIDALKRQVQTPQQARAALARSLPQFVTDSTGAPLPAPLQFISSNSSGESSSAPPAAASGFPNSPGGISPAVDSSTSHANAAKQGIAASGESSSPGQNANSVGGISPAADSHGFLSSLKSHISSMRLPFVCRAQTSPSTAPSQAPGQIAASAAPSNSSFSPNSSGAISPAGENQIFLTALKSQMALLTSLARGLI